MGKKTPSSLDEIQAMAAQLRSVSAEDKQLAAIESKLSASRGEATSLKKDNDRLVKRNQELSATLDQMANLVEQERIAAKPVRIELKKEPNHHAIAIVHWSDWHVAERVYRTKTNGKNAFNPDVCRARVKKLTENTLKLIELSRLHVRIEEMVLVLGGDFITGYLHEELAQTNCMGITEECYFAQELLERSVGTVLASAKMKKVRVVCHRGNHGRSSRRIQFKNDYETSFESLIYWNLRDRLTMDGVEWMIPQSDIAYTALVKGVELRTIHGHQIKYQGGIGGISIPLTKWIVRQNQTRPAIATMLGHFHTFNPAASYSIRGSLKGWDEYAQSCGFTFEEPSQLFELFDCRRQHLTARHPIFVE